MRVSLPRLTGTEFTADDRQPVLGFESVSLIVSMAQDVRLACLPVDERETRYTQPESLSRPPPWSLIFNGFPAGQYRPRYSSGYPCSTERDPLSLFLSRALLRTRRVVRAPFSRLARL